MSANYRLFFRRQSKLLFALLPLLFLFVLLVARVYDLGILHTDDAMWALWTHWPVKDSVDEWARDQGRIWAYVSGTFIRHTLQWQGTLYGEFLRLGGFAGFVLAFGWIVATYAGQRIALLALACFLATFMLRWDGSLLTVYPNLTWVNGMAYCAALGLLHRFARDGGVARLVVAGMLYFFALFNNEGVTLFFIVLAVPAVLANARLLDREPLVLAGLSKRSLQALLMVLLVSAAYAVIYLAWLRLHPTTYDGHSIAGFDVRRFLLTLLHFSTSGSALHDMFAPYSVGFGDAISNQGMLATYRLGTALAEVLHEPLAIAVGLTAAGLFAALLWRADSQAEPQPAYVTLGTGGLILAGLCMAIVPILPVAMTAKYQGWFFNANVRAYSHTIFSHFGWSLVLAVLLTKLRGPRLMRCATVAIATGLLAASAYVANERIADDMRTEAGRWHAAAQAVALQRAAFAPAYAWSPRLASGSMYAVLSPDYWSDYLRTRHGAKFQLSARIPDLNASRQGSLMFDFAWDRRGRRLLSLMADNPGMSKIAVFTGTAGKDALSAYVLAWRDAQGGEQRASLAELPAAPADATVRLLQRSGIAADSVRLLRTDSSEQEPLCVLRVPQGLRVMIGNEAPLRDSLAQQEAMLVAGWEKPEAGGVWSREATARIVVPALQLPPGDLLLRLNMSTFSGRGFTSLDQKVRLSVNGQPLASWSFALASNPPDLSVRLPKALRSAGAPLEFELSIDPLANPRALGVSGDGRNLGIWLNGLSIVPADAPAFGH